MATEILTISGFTRSLTEFLALLQENHVKILADVRRFPASRRHKEVYLLDAGASEVKQASGAESRGPAMTTCILR